ncbi:stage III sporulation protein AG [Paenibacillus sp. 1P07SE]|uniref:stage III sporulation protein AG n=1 Tax=Paenibacillus sp. 1P07SE TaxID=3132209 RepID=UPI0039A67391
MAKWLDQIEAMVGGGPTGPKRVRTLRWLLLIGCLGVALMIIQSFVNFEDVAPTVDQPPVAEVAPDPVLGPAREESESIFAAIERPLEQRLQEILEKIVGVGTVDVLVTIDSTEETVVQRNQKESEQITDETDRNGGKRHVASTTTDGQVVLYEVEGEKRPFVTKTIKPRIRGILIVARGAEDPTVRGLLMEAVQRGVQVPAHRISVVPSKQP